MSTSSKNEAIFASVDISSVDDGPHRKIVDDSRSNRNENSRLSHDKIAWAIMLLLGLGVLLPWNVALNAVDWFQSIYSSAISFQLPLAYTYPQIPLLGLMVKYGHLYSYTARIISTLLIQALVLGILPFIAEFGSYTTIIIMVIVGLCTAVLQASLMGFSSRFPPAFNAALMTGQGVAGILSGVVRIMTLVALPDENHKSAILYLELASAVLVICVGGYLVLLKREFTRYHLAKSSSRSAHDEMTQQLLQEDTGYDPELQPQAIGNSTNSLGHEFEHSDSQHLLTDSDVASPVANVNIAHRDRAGSDKTAFSLRVLSKSPLGLMKSKDGQHRNYRSARNAGSSSSSASFSSTDEAGNTLTWAKLKSTFFQVWLYGATVTAAFVMTFIVFPGVVDNIPYYNSIHLSTSDGKAHSVAKSWLVILTLIFNIFDTIGRSLPSWIRIGPRTLVILTAARFGLIPLFMACRYGWSGFQNDWITVVLLAVFAISNGFCGSSSMVLGPQQVPAHHRELAGFILSFFLQSGIALGSVFAYAV